MKIRKGDKVFVTSGKTKDKGVTSEVLKVYTEKNRVLVKDVNIATKHIKKAGTNPGQIVKIEKPVDVSNVMLVCPYTKKPTKLGYVFIEEKGKTKKFRYSKRALKENKGVAKDFIIK